MACYSIDGKMALVANDTIVHAVGGTTLPRRAFIYEVFVGSTSVAADASAELHFQRCTATPAGFTAVTARPLDLADAAAITSGGEIHTVEPTYTADLVMLNIPFHQRSTPRWVARHDRAQIVTPATTDNGCGLLCVTVNTAFTVGATIHFEE